MINACLSPSVPMAIEVIGIIFEQLMYDSPEGEFLCAFKIGSSWGNFYFQRVVSKQYWEQIKEATVQNRCRELLHR